MKHEVVSSVSVSCGLLVSVCLLQNPFTCTLGRTWSHDDKDTVIVSVWRLGSVIIMQYLLCYFHFNL